MDKPIKAILFDYDGVLGLEARGIYSTSRYLAAKSNIPYDDILSAYKHFVPKLEIGRITEEEIWTEFCERAGGTIDIKLLQPAFRSSVLNKDMMNIAKKLKKASYNTGIITSNSKLRTDALVKKHAFKALFDPIICGAVVGAAKGGRYGKVDIFKAAISPLKLQPENCIFIDNIKTNLEIPEAMGFHTYHHDAELNDILALKIYLSGFGLMV